jgi:peptidoglycan/xylan/chitin deacetylase (PgdA/CDA1 family)
MIKRSFVETKGKNIYKETKRFLYHSYNKFTDNKPKVLLLVYHRVLKNKHSSPLNNIVSLSGFIKQIDEIAKRHAIVTLTDIIQQCHFGKPKAKIQVVLTFDDGYSDNYEIVLPVLQKKGLPASFFIIADYINSNVPLWDWQVIHLLNSDVSIKSTTIDNQIIRQGIFESRLSFAFRILEKMKPISPAKRREAISYLRPKTNTSFESDRCMSWQEVKKMSEAGMEIGSHGLSHRSLAMLPYYEAKEEIKKSKEIIEYNIEKPCYHFSFPYGGNQDYNQPLIDCVKEAGYRTCLLNVHGYNYIENDSFCFKRIIMENATCVRHLLG